MNSWPESWSEAVARLESHHQPYVLITLLGVQGSTPRDSGAKMVMARNQDVLRGSSRGQQHREGHRAWGTIGGGHLEYQAMGLAAEMLKEGGAAQRLEHFPLGAGLGQCCGGRVSVLFECFPGADSHIVLFGAGHVGRALVSILAQLPCHVYWTDQRNAEFPGQIPGNVTRLVSDSPADEVAEMPPQSSYLVMTHQHALDFDIIEQVLKRSDVRYVGLIGSRTKWQRFKKRFEHRGYSENFYRRVRCPVGLAQVPGKRPMEVAVAVAAEMIADYHRRSLKSEVQTHQGVSWRELKQLDIAEPNLTRTEARTTVKNRKAAH